MNLVLPGGNQASVSGFLLRGRHAHHKRGRFPFFARWLKKLLSAHEPRRGTRVSYYPINSLQEPLGFLLRLSRGPLFGLLVLKQLEEVKDPKVLRAARQKRAHVQHERTGEYDEAIEVYLLLADPPDTLWGIQSCHKRAGRWKEAVATLNEIIGMFPKLAPRAMLTKAEYYREAGEHKTAAAIYRQILMAHKDSQESSTAHQRLEDYGLDPGGGVIRDL